MLNTKQININLKKGTNKMSGYSNEVQKILDHIHTNITKVKVEYSDITSLRIIMEGIKELADLADKNFKEGRK